MKRRDGWIVGAGVAALLSLPAFGLLLGHAASLGTVTAADLTVFASSATPSPPPSGDTTPPNVTSFTVKDAGGSSGGDGTIDAGDTWIITFSEAVTLAGSTTITTSVVVSDPDPNSGNASSDLVEVTGITNGSIPIGSSYISKGQRARSYAATATVDPANTITLTITGACTVPQWASSDSCNANRGDTGSSATFEYTPSTSIEDASGNGATDTKAVSVTLF